MRTVKDIIESKTRPLNIISSKALVIDALKMLDNVNLSYLVVMDDDVYKGIFSEKDYTRNVILQGRSSNETKIKEVMTIAIPVVELKDTVEYCMNLMNIRKTRYLSAFDDNHFIGIVTIHDLLRQVISGKEDVFDHSTTHTLLDNDESGRIY